MGGLGQKGEEGRTQEHTKQCREDADRQRKEHQYREPTRLSFRAPTIARAKRISLCHEKTRQRRAEPRGSAHQCGDASLGRSRAAERAERFARAASESEIREKSSRLRKTRDHRRASDEGAESELEREASLETDNHRVEKRRQVGTGGRESKDPPEPEASGDFEGDGNDENEAAAIEHHRKVFRSHDREEHPTERRQRDEDDRRHATLRRERLSLVLERDASTQQRRDASETSPDLAAAPRERAKDDREWREVFSRHDPGVRTDGFVNGRTEGHRRRRTFGRQGERTG